MSVVVLRQPSIAHRSFCTSATVSGMSRGGRQGWACSLNDINAGRGCGRVPFHWSSSVSPTTAFPFGDDSFSWEPLCDWIWWSTFALIDGGDFVQLAHNYFCNLVSELVSSTGWWRKEWKRKKRSFEWRQINFPNVTVSWFDGAACRSTELNLCQHEPMVGDVSSIIDMNPDCIPSIGCQHVK